MMPTDVCFMYMSVCARVCVYVYVCVCVCAYVFVCVHVCVCAALAAEERVGKLQIKVLPYRSSGQSSSSQDLQRALKGKREARPHLYASTREGDEIRQRDTV